MNPNGNNFDLKTVLTTQLSNPVEAISKLKAVKNILVAYHSPCIDGMTAAYIVNKALIRDNPELEYINNFPMNYREDYYQAFEEEIISKHYDVVIFVDFALPMDVFYSVANLMWVFNTIEPTMILTLDHHETAIKRYFNLDGAPSDFCSIKTYKSAISYFDMAHSGAGIAWQLFNPQDEVPYWIKLVEDYDLWKFKYGDDTRYFNKFISQVNMDLLSYENLDSLAADKEGWNDIIEQGKTLFTLHTEEVNNYVKLATDITICGETGLIVTVDHKRYVSDVGNKLAEQSKTFGACVIKHSDGSQEISLRSIGEYSALSIAEQMGGGGHKNAAGFILPPDTIISVGEY